MTPVHHRRGDFSTFKPDADQRANGDWPFRSQRRSPIETERSMLPPVPKIAATDAAYGTTVPLMPRGQVKETTPPQPSNPVPENSGSLFARAAIASLTSEFQLSRSTAVLAEALGKLMNLPRRDGE